eukprot:scaffold26224_cov63-Attheya_sp.AAC.5
MAKWRLHRLRNYRYIMESCISHYQVLLMTETTAGLFDTGRGNNFETTHWTGIYPVSVFTL